ncbi:MAG: hypothetical protein MR303_10100 [Emergencia sp.]|nr:hypothetical protein [Emergencia sp.]
MLCKIFGNDNRIFNFTLIIAGAVAIVFGLWYSYITPEEMHHLQMLAGMFTGMGSAFLAIGVFFFLHSHFGSAEKKKQREIERNDERNVQITCYAMSIAAFAAVLFSAILIFVFTALNYILPSMLILAGVYIELAVFLIAFKILERKM